MVGDYTLVFIALGITLSCVHMLPLISSNSIINVEFIGIPNIVCALYQLFYLLRCCGFPNSTNFESYSKTTTLAVTVELKLITAIYLVSGLTI